MACIRLNETFEYADPHDAELKARIEHAYHVTLRKVSNPAWAAVIANAFGAKEICLRQLSQELLDAIGRILPRLFRLRTLRLQDSGMLRPPLDFSRFFDGCNDANGIRIITFNVRAATSATDLEPQPLQRIRIEAGDDCNSQLLEALIGNHVELFIPSDAPMTRTARTIRNHPLESLTLVYCNPKTAMKCATRDFIDSPGLVYIAIVSMTVSSILAQIDANREFQKRRLLFVLATAATGPAKRFAEGSGDGALVERIKRYL